MFCWEEWKSMNIEVKDKDTGILEKICIETQMDSSRLVEYFLGIIRSLYIDYKRQKNIGVEKRPFIEILSDLFLHSIQSKLVTLDAAKHLISLTDELIGIQGYIGAGILSIIPDFYKRRVSYMVGYDLCVDKSITYTFEKVLIGIEINEDYIEVSSHTAYQNPPERMDITDKKMYETSSLIEEYIRAKYREKFAPFANIIVELSPIDENWIDSSMKTAQSIGIKVIVKANNADHIPSIENICIIASEVHVLVHDKLLAR
jgi:hypothetical protein